MNVPETSEPPLRLNPFAFPSNTDFRFVLLIVAVIGASMLLARSTLTIGLPGLEERIATMRERCYESALASYPTDSIEDRRERTMVRARCLESVQRIEAATMIGGLALLLGTAGAIYWAYPAWKIWRGRLMPLSTDDAPEMVAYLENLCREVGLSRPPTFVWNPLNMSSMGLAFGRLGRYYVALTGGLAKQFFTDRPAFRAVLLHELAHLRNADVSKTYFAVALVYAFVFVVLVPWILSILAFSGPLIELLGMGWRVVTLLIVVYLTYTAVLRAREVYADVRASKVDGPAGALGRMFENASEPNRYRWLDIVRVHPAPSRRRKLLVDTRPLFHLGFFEVFVTGIATMMPLNSLYLLLSGVLPTARNTSLAAGLILAPVVVGVVGLGVWRKTFAAMAEEQRPQGVGRLGLALGLGMLVGQELTFADYAYSRPQAYSAVDLPNLAGQELLLFYGIWGTVLIFGMFLFLRWLSAGASTWMVVATATNSPRRFFWPGLVIPSVVLAAWLGMLFSYVYVLRTSSSHIEQLQQIAGASFSGLLGTYRLILLLLALPWSSPLATFTLTCLWIYPLAAALWHRRKTPEPSSDWAFLDSSSRHLALLQQFPLRLSTALRSGLIGSVVYVALLVAFPVWRRAPITWSGPELLARLELFAIFIQASVAVFVASRVRWLGSVQGLFAAFVAGCVMVVGTLIFVMVFGPITFEFAVAVFQIIVTGGALIALPLALGTSALIGWLRSSNRQ